MQDVDERRGKIKRYNTDPKYKEQVDEEKRARAKAERAADPPVTLFDIILPVAPFGIPGAVAPFTKFACLIFAVCAWQAWPLLPCIAMHGSLAACILDKEQKES